MNVNNAIMEKKYLLTDKELSDVNGGIAPGILLGLYMAGYTMGKDFASRKR
ncbi:class IIb bacteriocin, lactobin A/cerein 7B family [Fructobacillus durionis]|uniref:Class IIb bacteriocin, lactobin A/cerein 7B family n=1 Tax=Fructobacillus durionis TaxID=283737 RepID=A0A1I1F4E6_9LACO|nr:class IIb bacteriocin, lactobin A/cerein 7B family [Fructobacillus durionis]SFB93826.1 class IIb bacteriocin, lactobin A/cerein 7B family [Fructobacillus durionis]